MQMTVLGCYGPYPPAGAACSGYLVQEEGCNILIDCGNGTLSRLQQYLNFWELDAILLSHLHADHVSDIMIMRYGLEMAYKQGRRSEPLPLYAPAEPISEFERLSYKNAYLVEALNPEQEIHIGPFLIKAMVGVHAIPTMALRIETTIGILVYTGDTEYFAGLIGFACEADLFLCEANYQDLDLHQNLPNHLSASQAAQIAAAAGVKRALLTHHHPDRNLAVSIEEARKYYPGIEAATEGATYTCRGNNSYGSRSGR